MEKIRGLLLVGASAADVGEAIDDGVLIVNDARCSRPELATVTTQQSCVQMMMEHFEGGADLLKVCKTSSAWMVKSIVDATRMEGDWGEIVAKIKENVSPKEVDEIVRWGDEYYQELSAKVLRKRLDVVRRFAAHVESGSVAEKTYYNAPIDALRRREGEMAEVYDSLLGSVQDEMEMHPRGCATLARLSPGGGDAGGIVPPDGDRPVPARQGAPRQRAEPRNSRRTRRAPKGGRAADAIAEPGECEGRRRRLQRGQQGEPRRRQEGWAVPSDRQRWELLRERERTNERI